jgi:hypothetical protein
MVVGAVQMPIVLNLHVTIIVITVAYVQMVLVFVKRPILVNFVKDRYVILNVYMVNVIKKLLNVRVKKRGGVKPVIEKYAVNMVSGIKV